MPKTVRDCVIDGCTERASWKGLCIKCYKDAKALVLKDETTWEQLEEKGLARLSTTEVSKFRKAYNDKMKEG